MLQLSQLPDLGSGLVSADPTLPTYAWLVRGNIDSSVAFAARALGEGVTVHVAKKAFTSGGQAYQRGTLVVRREENDHGVEATLDRVAHETAVVVHRTYSGRSPDDGPDLGGREFALLAVPRVALIANSPVSPTAYGHIWRSS
ncbi:MAG: hypothetical protein V3V08_20320 [Nannocystaceae bacterium]